jgi:hypothetical protein
MNPKGSNENEPNPEKFKIGLATLLFCERHSVLFLWNDNREAGKVK